MQVAEVLSKLVRMVAEFTVIVERREPIMKAIKDIEEVFKEAHWHFLHKQDNSFSNRVRVCTTLIPVSSENRICVPKWLEFKELSW